ncbi:unnamed protein product [Lepeophtheirus salmonis]|uniref:(salmon louse) hypothetical protein n=1 Tax=Lepeophtheirus salmonis TaxID=72036 RepID=A0A7R8H3T6_LEPSM|nr:unnamed protein product [Lepeophtheirus salmonis]CAF2847525.1 unnamed protein product [Lepeophtheirus salmonis]
MKLVYVLAIFLMTVREIYSEEINSDVVSDIQNNTASNSQIRCYACGLEYVDPEIDKTGSYGDSRRNWTAPGKKYDKWIRDCPVGVRSCFWAQGRHNDAYAIFRGCATAKYAYMERCDREIQAVQMKKGRKSTDVEVMLCFCNANICNFKIEGGASTLKMSSGIICSFIFAQFLYFQTTNTL